VGKGGPRFGGFLSKIRQKITKKKHFLPKNAIFLYILPKIIYIYIAGIVRIGIFL